MNKRRFLSTCAACAAGMMLPSIGFRSEGRALFGESFIAGDDRPWKWAKEAEFYSRTASGVQCMKCPHRCALGEGESGRCRSRVVSKGRLWSIAYGNPCAVHIDPIEKKPFFHMMPATRAFSIAAAGCNFRCLNCQNWQISQFSPKDTANEDLMPAEVVRRAEEEQCRSIAYTYSEPTTFYEYAYDTAKLAKARGLKNLLKSNGYINTEPLKKLCTVLDAANIDLKTFDNAAYGKLSGGTLQPVLDTLKTLVAEGVWLEITNLVIPGWSDDIGLITKMSDWLVRSGLADCPLHFSRFTPLYKLNRLPMTPVATLESARAAALKAGMRYVYIGNVPSQSAENTWCARCGKLVIERKGFAILQNKLSKGNCGFCGHRIPGRW
jgi:pyruvate formate lyase activating enzyme